MSESKEDPVKVQHNKRVLFEEQTSLTGVHYGYEETQATLGAGKQKLYIRHLNLDLGKTGVGLNECNDITLGNDKQSIASDNSGEIILKSKKHGALRVQSNLIADAINQTVIDVFQDDVLTVEEGKKMRAAQKLLAKSIKRGDMEVEAQHIVTAFQEAAAEGRKSRS